MGKTRLAHELADRARSLGWDVLWGSCSEAELALPYLPFVEALGNHFAGRSPERDPRRARRRRARARPALPAARAEDAPRRRPAIRRRRSCGSSSPSSPCSACGARGGASLLVVDDIHWADASTRELLDHLARRLKDVPALVLCTYRSDELQRRHPLLPTLQAGGGRGSPRR